MRISMIAILKCNKLGSAGKFFSQLKRTFIRLSSTVYKIDTVERFRQLIGQQLSETALRFLNIFAIHHYMQMLIKLLFDCFNHIWMTMTQAAHGDSGDQIQIRFSIFRMDMASLGTIN